MDMNNAIIHDQSINFSRSPALGACEALCIAQDRFFVPLWSSNKVKYENIRFVKLQDQLWDLTCVGSNCLKHSEL